MVSTEAPSLYTALSAQKKQALYELIGHYDPKAIVAIEKDDDVSVTIDDSVELIQVKTANSSTNNPLSNASDHLWKTLDNWVQKLASQNLKNRIKHFRYSVCSSRTINSGEIADLFNNAIGRRDAEEAYDQELQRYRTSSNANRHRSSFFDAKNRAYAIEVIQGFSFELHPRFMEETASLFYEMGSYSDIWKESLFCEMIGWFDNAVTADVERGLPAQICRVDYHRQLISCSERFRANPLDGPVSEPSNEEAKRELESQPCYLKQLDLIGLLDEEGLRAAIECLRSRVHIQEWACGAVVTSYEIERYQETLKDNWLDIRGEKLSDSRLGDMQNVGRSIFYASRQAARGVQIRRSNLPGYMGSGQLHDLANIMTIGWHPNYSSLLSAEAESGDDDHE